MIDIHSHILPNIDHGAKDMQTTMKMLRIAEEQGTTIIVGTPHYYEDILDIHYNDVLTVLDEVKKEAKAIGLKIEVYAGQEVHFHIGLARKYKEGRLGTINASRYMLLELPNRELTQDIFNEIYLLQQEGVIPIIAHPERHKTLLRNNKEISKLLNKGYLFQLNGGSLLGQFNDKVKSNAEEFLKMGLYSFIGSDSHSDAERGTGLKEALYAIEKLVGKDVINTFSENGLKVINNKIITLKNLYKKQS